MLSQKPPRGFFPSSIGTQVFSLWHIYSRSCTSLASKTVVLLSGSTDICISLWTSLALCLHPLKQLRTLQPNTGDKCKVETTICIFCRRLWTRPSDYTFVWSCCKTTCSSARLNQYLKWILHLKHFSNSLVGCWVFSSCPCAIRMPLATTKQFRKEQSTSLSVHLTETMIKCCSPPVVSKSRIRIKSLKSMLFRVDHSEKKWEVCEISTCSLSSSMSWF